MAAFTTTARLSVPAIQQYLAEVSAHYQPSRPQVARAARDLARRLARNPRSVSLQELLEAQAYRDEEGHWMPAERAQNWLYHCLAEAGLPTTGIWDA